MGSLRAKQGSITELIEAVHLGQLRGLTTQDRLLAEPLYQLMEYYRIDETCKLYLPFDETSGSTAHDLSGNGNTGTATGTTIVDGVFGKAREFDGLDDYVDCGNDTSLQLTGDMTLEAWVKIPHASSDNPIISKDGGTGDRGWYAVKLSSTDPHANRIRTAVAINSTSIAYFDTTDTLPDDIFTHLAVVYDGSTLKVYFNGVLKSGTQTGTVPATQRNATIHVTVGEKGAIYVSGNIDEVRIYSRTLTADEIYLHYLAGALKLGLI